MLSFVDTRFEPPTRCDDAAAAESFVREDFAENVGSLLAPVFHDDGSVTVEARIARPGIYVYRNADGSTRRELVSADVLHDPASLETLKRVSVTLTHPSERRVSAENADAVIQGDVGETITVDPEGYVRALLRIRLPAAVEALRRGVREISPGYSVAGRYDPTPGVDPVHGPYDARQLGRTYNHVAIVDRARGGHGCEARVDSESVMNPTLAMLLAACCGAQPTEGMTDAAAGKMITDAFQKCKTDAESAAGKAAAAEQAKGAAERAATDAKGKCDAAEALLAYDGTRAPKADDKAETARLDALDAYADARAQVRTLAAKAGVEDKALKGKSLAESRRIVATKLDGTIRADATDAYIEAFLDVKAKDAACEDHPVRAAFEANRADHQDRQDGADGKRRVATVVDDPAFASRMKGLARTA